MRRGIGLLLAVPELVQLIRSKRPTMILSSGNHMHLVAAAAHAIARARSSALVLKMTNPVERPNKGRLSNMVRRGWYGWAFGRADKVLVIADTTRAELAEQYPQIGSKLRVVDNPYITEAMIEAGRSANGFEPGRLLAIGRLVSQKNYPLLLRALAQISELDWTLDILGDGPLLVPLQSQARALGIGHWIRFRGFVTDPVPYLRSAHALVLSSAWEGQGAVLLEALASGCPVIATRSTAAVGDVLADGLYGKLTPADDEAALAKPSPPNSGDAQSCRLRRPPGSADTGSMPASEAISRRWMWIWPRGLPPEPQDGTVRETGPLVGVSADGR